MSRESGRFQERGYHLGQALKDGQDSNRQKRNGAPSRQVVDVPLAPASILPWITSSTQRGFTCHQFPSRRSGDMQVVFLSASWQCCSCSLDKYPASSGRSKMRVPECRAGCLLSSHYCIHYLVLFALRSPLETSLIPQWDFKWSSVVTGCWRAYFRPFCAPRLRGNCCEGHLLQRHRPKPCYGPCRFCVRNTRRFSSRLPSPPLPSPLLPSPSHPHPL